MYSIDSIGQILRPKQALITNKDSVITHLVYDSRKVADAKGSLFFALKAVRDGHRFIADAYQKGLRSFVISDANFPIASYPEANFLIVADVLQALQDLAQHVRKSFHKPVIGITGSNGKTVVKEWLTQLIGADKKIYQSPKSYNSQLGVALALWNLNNDYDYALIEAGISLPGEMEQLEKMISPDIGIFTNIGLAHAAGFETKAQKLAEKLKLFAHSHTLISGAKYNLSSLLTRSMQEFTFGEGPTHTLQVEYLHEEAPAHHSLVQLSYQAEICKVNIPFIDKASLENVLLCISTMLYLGYSLAEVSQRIVNLKPLEMRLQLRNGKNNCTLIDDSYSNDLASLQIALDFLDQQQQHAHKTLILSEMEGMNAQIAAKLVKLLNAQSLQRILLVGKQLYAIADQLEAQVAYFETTALLLADLKKLNFTQETILIKGSRNFHLEDVSQQLSAKTHETVLEINLHAIEHNLQAYRALLPQEVKLMAMVKAFSYGSGSFEVANLLRFNKVDYLTVAFADEGIELRQHGIDLPIMVLSPDEQVFEALVQHKLEPEIYNFRILRKFIHFLQEKEIKQYPIHLKVDTGMHRLGFLPSEITLLAMELNVADEVKVCSVFSHLAASGDPAKDNFTQQQIDLLNSCAAAIEEAIGYSFLRHIANTSGIVRWPAAYMDMVRLGIGLYGVDMDHSALDLQTVGQLRTTISQIKELAAGETIGYDRKGLLTRKSRIATVKIGYADGYNRRFGNGQGKMRLNGHLVPTIGSICMDMCMLDVTDVEAQEEDEVIVFPDIAAAAKSIDTIPYELLVGIAGRVKRIYYYE